MGTPNGKLYVVVFVPIFCVKLSLSVSLIQTWTSCAELIHQGVRPTRCYLRIMLRFFIHRYYHINFVKLL